MVCGQAAEGGQLPRAALIPATLRERLGEALHARIGPLEFGSIDTGDGTRAFGARVRF